MPKLRTVRPGVDLGYRRTRVGAGFRYTDADGGALPDAERERAVALVIPPGWTDVWISAAPNGHIQATGIDGAGRLQYLYHPDWSTGRDKGKYARALQLAGSLPRARGRVTTSLRRADLDRERVLATAFRLLDLAAPRVGSERLVTHGQGLTTLRRRDAATSASSSPCALSRQGGKDAAPRSRRRRSRHRRDAARGRPPRLAPARLRAGARHVPLRPKSVSAYVRTMTGERSPRKTSARSAARSSPPTRSRASGRCRRRPSASAPGCSR
ncbi:MAG: DNA topoisomerase IB [Microbacterium sp.]